MHFPPFWALRGQLLPHSRHIGSTKLKQSSFGVRFEMVEMKGESTPFQLRACIAATNLRSYDFMIVYNHASQFFSAASKLFVAPLSKKWVCSSLHRVCSFMEAAYQVVNPIIGNTSLFITGGLNSAWKTWRRLNLYHWNTEDQLFSLSANFSTLDDGLSYNTKNPRINDACCDKQQQRGTLAQWIKISLKCPNASLCFARGELDYSEESTQKLIESYYTALSTHPKLSIIISCVRHPVSYMGQPSTCMRAILDQKLISLNGGSLIPKFCTEVGDNVLKPTHEDGGSRSHPEDCYQTSPSISCPAIATPP